MNFREFIIDGHQVCVNTDNVAYIVNLDNNECDVYFIGIAEPVRMGFSAPDLVAKLKNPHITGVPF